MHDVDDQNGIYFLGLVLVLTRRAQQPHFVLEHNELNQ